MENKTIILAFPGCGKSYLVKKYSNIVDNDFCYFKFIYDKPAENMTDDELELRKGNKEIEKLNPNYPENLVNATFKALNKHKIVLIPLSKGTYEIFKNLEKENRLVNIRVIMVYPAKKDFDDFIKRYKSRGNSEVFMQYNHIKCFNEWENMFNNEQSFDKVNIKSDEYLEDILKRLHIKLDPK